MEGDYSTFESIDTEQYKSIYSFTNEVDETSGTNIEFVDYEDMQTENYVKVISGLNGHNKIVERHTGQYGGTAIFEHYLDSGHVNGTVEFFMRTDAAGKRSYVDLTSGSPYGLLIYIDDGKFRYQDFYWYNIRSASSNTWYHVRIDFECGSGGYEGLAADTFYIYIDGVKYGPYSFNNGKSSIDKIRFGGYSPDDDYSSYYDDFGFSWDSNYSIGDNRYSTNYVSEKFEFSLGDLPYDYDTCELYHSVKTSSSQNVSLFLYNFTKSSWYKYNIISTDNSTFSNGTYIFTSADFLSCNNTIKVLMNLTTDSVGSFDLYLESLELKYNWTRAHADLGIGSESIGLLIDYEMSSWNSTVFSNNYAYEEEGFYLVTLSACDGNFTTSSGKLIEIINSAPYNPFGIFCNASFEDTSILFTSNLGISEDNSTIIDCMYFWNFGDGTYSNERNPSHSYADSGIYNISLTVVDCYGNQFTDMRNITIIESVPTIVGPYTIHGIENQAIDLDIDIFDTPLDERKLEYSWYNSTDSLISTDKKPSIFLNSGSYQYLLNVTDELDNTATANISVIVEDAPPVLFISNYMYSGGNTSESEGFFTGEVDGPGELELRAYGYDLGDINDLTYYWTIIAGNTIYVANDLNAGTSSTKNFRVTETAVYLGQVKLVSSNMSSVTNFIINSFVDSNGNGISNEMEELILEHYDNVSSYSDTDNDGLSDLYEIDYNITNYLDPDSDDDGLWDGIHNVTGIGEQSLSTNPDDPDCDDDLLLDGIEFYGWNITTDFYGQITVNSDPWNNDTDGDGLSDYEEYTIGTHPRSTDSDNDGLGDEIDPYPTKFDYDGDGLSDKIEFDLGTALNVSDTDNDGLSDAEEQLGWFKTDPLSADSDHDFASDTAEMQNYKASIDDRYDMNDPISITFEVNCEKAASAQIAFMITFGEAINEPGNDKVYGVQDVPELNVTIYKVDDDLLLFNLTSSEFNQTSEDGSTRYLSRVVDIRESIENNSLDYRGVYMIEINNTNAGCMLEQFDIEIAGYLDPWDSDFDNDGIMDGIEMGLLVPGVAAINSSDIYGENITVQFPIEETCWWMLDEGSGTSAGDLSAYENNGVLTNMESGDWKTGKIGDYALEFDGIDEYIDCGNEYYLDFERNNTFSLSAWIKTSSVNGTIISKMNVSDDSQGYDLYCNENGKIRAHLVNSLDSNELIVDSTTIINDNQWYFIVMTYNGSSDATGISIYINGTLDNLTTITNTLNNTIHTNANFLIGARTESDYFAGMIDDVRVYRYALSQDNVTWLHNSGNGRPAKPLNGDSDPEVELQYSLEIPYVGVVYDANVTVSIESESTPLGGGNITIEILKEEINCSINNVVFSSALEQFSNTTQFSYGNFIDITPYINNNSITEFYGKYLLNVKIEGNDYRDKFIITEFYLRTDTFIEAGTTDTEAWCTDPAKFDTDDDGWSDYKEIYVEETNPLSCDTDGDQVWDPYDRDPHQDVMLKITPISGSAPSDYNLVVVIKFTVDGSGDTYYIPTLKQKADVYENPLWTAYYDGTNGSPTELHYYANINDDIRLPNTYDLMRFDLELWRVDRYFGIIKKWDKKLVSGDDYYSINQPGHSETLKVDIKDESEQVKYEAKVKVETIGIEKANTIAIYETNGTVFNGHYQEQERMNIIQLYVNDSGTGTPFEEGLNTIIIPTSSFTETIFNAHIQNETLNQTTIYRNDEELFKFISVGRDGETEQACEEIDFIIIRFDISSEDAMEVLKLLLECLVNETTNETAIVYSYVSTKENNTVAVMMNLPFSILGLIPWYCDFENSPMGSKPETFEDWFWKPLATIGMLILGVIITIGMAFAELFIMMVDFIVAIFMEILPILGYILWLIICTLILIFIYILFVIALISIITIFVFIIPFFYLYSLFVGGQVNIKNNAVSIQKDEKFMKMKYSIGFESIPFFAFNVPTIDISYESQNTTYNIIFNFFTEEVPLISSEIFRSLIESNNSAQSSGLQMSSNQESSSIQFFKGISTAVLLFGTFLIIISQVLGFGKGSIPPPLQYALSIVTCISFILAAISFRESTNGMTKAYAYGLALGTFINIIVLLSALVAPISFSSPLLVFIIAVSSSLTNLILTANIIGGISWSDVAGFIKSGTSFVTLLIGSFLFLGIDLFTRFMISLFLTVILAVAFKMFLNFPTVEV